MHTLQLIGRLAATTGLVVGALAAPAATHATTLTLFAEQSVVISGSRNDFCGVAHSNGNVRITGTDNAVSGIFEYAGTFHANDNNTTNAVKTAIAPLPAPAHDLAYYRELAQTQGTYAPGDADLGSISGVVFAEGNIRFSGSGVTGSVTFVSAGGEIKLSGSNNALTPAVDGVLFFTATGDADIEGSHSLYTGGMYAPGGNFARHGADDSNITGPVVARTISWSGSRNHLGGECCADATDCRPATACDIPSCGADGTCGHAPLADCVPCTTDAGCDDGDACNGLETCPVGICTPGSPVTCDDGDACTIDSCDAAAGCVHTPLDCDDHDAGTADSCDPTAGCRNPPIDCDDQNPCTVDTRDPVAGCIHTNADDGTRCGDADACHGSRTCRTGVCRLDSPPDCDDRNACTTDACSNRSGGCVHADIPGCIPCATEADCPVGDECSTAVCAGGVCDKRPVENCPRACSPEVCGDGTDNDCDGFADCTDPDCASFPRCTAPPPPGEICGDCIDNDGDGTVDAQDPDCCAAPLAFGAKVVQLRPLTRKGDRVRLMGIFSPTTPTGFDPMIQDTSVQITDAQGPLFCTTIAASHWMAMGKRTIAFWDKQRKGSFSNGLSDGRFKIARDGSVIFRTHGRNATLRTPIARNLHITVRVGDRCSQTTTTLRSTKTGLALP